MAKEVPEKELEIIFGILGVDEDEEEKAKAAHMTVAQWELLKKIGGVNVWWGGKISESADLRVLIGNGWVWADPVIDDTQEGMVERSVSAVTAAGRRALRWRRQQKDSLDAISYGVSPVVEEEPEEDKCTID